MKTVRKLALLLMAAATARLAQAQAVQVLPAGQAYVFSGTAASGTGTITYQWYRNNELIAGATNANYTLPGNLAYGTNVELKRGVVSSTCPYSISYTNTFIITFCEGAITGSVCWAKANVAQPGAFVAKPDMYTHLYQWNRTTAWPTSGSIVGWNSTADQSTVWTVNPCPDGWRLPTRGEFQALLDAGNTWVEAGTRGAAGAGRFYGANYNTPASCTLPHPMINCVFLPATINRTNTGTISQAPVGSYWSSTQYDSSNGYIFNLSSSVSSESNSTKAGGLSVRCVQ